MEEVILVNKDDLELGVMEKMQAHEEGLLHRAFSIFLFNSKKEMLIHQRALSKYHSPGLWTNTCCSHPRKGETLEAAAHRRLFEEMGMKSVLEHNHSFIYKVELDQGMTEHELDHVFLGVTDVLPVINPEEVNDYQYLTIEECLQWVNNKPEDFTEWFKIALPVVVERLTL